MINEYLTPETIDNITSAAKYVFIASPFVIGSLDAYFSLKKDYNSKTSASLFKEIDNYNNVFDHHKKTHQSNLVEKLFCGIGTHFGKKSIIRKHNKKVTIFANHQIQQERQKQLENDIATVLPEGFKVRPGSSIEDQLKVYTE